jgi:hypothetical protein
MRDEPGPQNVRQSLPVPVHHHTVTEPRIFSGLLLTRLSVQACSTAFDDRRAAGPPRHQVRMGPRSAWARTRRKRRCQEYQAGVGVALRVFQTGECPHAVSDDDRRSVQARGDGLDVMDDVLEWPVGSVLLGQRRRPSAPPPAECAALPTAGGEVGEIVPPASGAVETAVNAQQGCRVRTVLGVGSIHMDAVDLVIAQFTQCCSPFIALRDSGATGIHRRFVAGG